MNILKTGLRVISLLACALALSVPGLVLSQACSNRGDLDQRYCDEDRDLLADQPKDPKAWQDPATLIFSYTPVEDPAVYENVFADFLAHLTKVTGKLVSGGIVRCAGRGDALGPPAHRRYRNGADAVRGESRGFHSAGGHGAHRRPQHRLYAARHYAS